MSNNMSSDYGVYKPPKSPTTGRANPPKSPSISRAAPPPPPKSPSASRKSSVAAPSAPVSEDQPPRSPRSPRVQRVAESKPPPSWGAGGGGGEARYEPLVGNDTDENSGCAACGAPHRPGARFCDACGADLRGKSKAAALFSTSDWALNPGRYALFGWMETVVGVIGLAVGFGSLFAFQNPGEALTELRIAEAVMVALGLVVFLVLLVQRFFYKEMFAFVYAALALGGAICAMIVVLSHNRQPGSFFMVYFFAWMVAHIVKLFWLCCADFGPTSQFQLEQHPLLDTKMKLFIVSGFMVLINMIGFIVQLYILTSTYEEF